MHRIRIAAVILALGFFLPAALGAERGWFGMTVKVDGAGFFLNPTLKSATIQKVAPDSPAAKQRVAVGDQIIEIEGHAVAGQKAKDLEPLMQKTVGETLRLRLKRQNGQIYAAELIAAPEPK